MPFPMKVQPIDSPEVLRDSISSADAAKLPMFRSRLRKLFDRQLPSVLRISSTERQVTGGNEAAAYFCKDEPPREYEPSSVCLAKMVQNYIEGSNEKQSAIKCGRSRCNCFNGNNGDDSSDDDELDPSSGNDACEILKSLVVCANAVERNLSAEAANIVEQSKTCNNKKDELRKMVTDGLSDLGYDASICRSRWGKSPSFPAGEYEYVDVIVQGERLLIEVDFRSEFELARSTSSYRSVIQSLPYIFVGKPDRLKQIVSIVSEAAKHSLKKRGMHVPPWRKAEYVRSKWLSPYSRTPTAKVAVGGDEVEDSESMVECSVGCERKRSGDFELSFGWGPSSSDSEKVEKLEMNDRCCVDGKRSGVLVAVPHSMGQRQPPAMRAKSSGLAFLLKEKD